MNKKFFILIFFIILYPSVILAANGTVLTKTGGSLANGSYYLNSNISLTSNITIASGREVIIDLNGYTLKGNGTGSVITNNGTLTIEDNNTVASNSGMITNGNATYGGGINNQGELLITGGTIAGNTATYGGGIYNAGNLEIQGGIIGTQDITVTWSDNTQTEFLEVKDDLYILDITNNGGNTATYDGGGIFNSGDMTLVDGCVAGNYAADQGGGIYSQVNGYIEGGTIWGNKAEGNGAGIAAYDYLEMTGGLIQASYTTDYAGGLDVWGDIVIGGDVEISYNSALINGGGITIENKAKLTINSGTVSNNVAIGKTNVTNSGRGGAIRCVGDLIINGGTISDNVANTDGGAIHATADVSSSVNRIAHVYLNGGEISNNYAKQLGGGLYISSEVLETVTLEMTGGKILNNTSEQNGGGIYLSVLEGGFEAIITNGEIAGNHSNMNGGAIAIVLSDSAVSGNLVVGEENSDLLISGNTSKQNGGAFYLEGGAVVMNGGDIEFCEAEQNGGAIYLSNGDFMMNGGNIGNVEENQKEGNEASCGGGAYVIGGNFTMNGGSIKGNTATDSGGGIQISEGNVYIKDGEISNNLAKGETSTAGYGGGIFVDGGEEVKITGGVISNNIAAKNGGGLEVKTDNVVTVEIYSGTFEYNVAEDSGGAVGIECSNGTINVGKMYCDGSTSSGHIHPVLKNNIAGLHGGGFYMSGANAILNIACATIDDNKIGNVENNFEQLSGTITVYESVDIGSSKEGIIVTGGTFIDKGQTEESECVVTYYCNYEGSTQYKNASVTKGSSITLPGNIFGIEGYDVLGWTTNPDDTNTIEYNVGQIIDISENITIYALWVEESENEPTYIVMIPSGIELDSNNQSATFEINATLTLFPRTKVLVVNLVEADMKLELLADNNQIVSEILYTLSQSESETYSNSNTILEVYSETALIEHEASQEFTIELEDNEPIYSGVYVDNLTFECEMLDV